VNRSKLWLDRGKLFGEEGEGFERINIACPRASLEAALFRLERAVLQSQSVSFSKSDREVTRLSHLSPVKVSI
jgi:hypothetical protein